MGRLSQNSPSNTTFQRSEEACIPWVQHYSFPNSSKYHSLLLSVNLKSSLQHLKHLLSVQGTHTGIVSPSILTFLVKFLRLQVFEWSYLALLHYTMSCSSIFFELFLPCRYSKMQLRELCGLRLCSTSKQLRDGKASVKNSKQFVSSLYMI